MSPSDSKGSSATVGTDCTNSHSWHASGKLTCSLAAGPRPCCRVPDSRQGVAYGFAAAELQALANRGFCLAREWLHSTQNSYGLRRSWLRCQVNQLGLVVAIPYMILAFGCRPRFISCVVLIHVETNFDVVRVHKGLWFIASSQFANRCSEMRDSDLHRRIQRCSIT